MKKTIILVTVAIILGTIVGNILYKEKDSISAFSENRAYFLEEGIYATKELVNRNTSNLNNKLVVKVDGKFKVYLGITTNLDIANKIIKMYKEKGYNLLKEEKSINNETFYTMMSQFDILVQDVNTLEEIEKIEEVILTSYQSLIEGN